MSGNAKFRWFLLAPALLCFLSACASTGTLDNTSSTLQTNTSREVKLEGEERAKCEWERGYRKGPGEVLMECNDYSGEPRVQGYELCPPGWHDKFVAGVYSEGESRNKEQVRSGICVHNTTEGRQCKAGQGCRNALRCEQCLWDLENVYLADMYGEAASWYPCDMC
ncbi:MAG: hypothetical protein NZ820_05365 [Dehalococcoidia bacterium]|nr:hypothetical protein [Dehalococcoidia bacterium]